MINILDAQESRQEAERRRELQHEREIAQAKLDAMMKDRPRLGALKYHHAIKAIDAELRELSGMDDY